MAIINQIPCCRPIVGSHFPAHIVDESIPVSRRGIPIAIHVNFFARICLISNPSICAVDDPLAPTEAGLVIVFTAIAPVKPCQGPNPVYRFGRDPLNGKSLAGISLIEPLPRPEIVVGMPAGGSEKIEEIEGFIRNIHDPEQAPVFRHIRRDSIRP